MWLLQQPDFTFTDAVLKDLDAHGIDREEVTLHVGAGTFKPVKSLEIEGHQMHTEYIVVHRRSLEKLIKHECRVIAVGTTSVAYHREPLLHGRSSAEAS